MIGLKRRDYDDRPNMILNKKKMRLSSSLNKLGGNTKTSNTYSEEEFSNLGMSYKESNGTKNNFHINNVQQQNNNIHNNISANKNNNIKHNNNLYSDIDEMFGQNEDQIFNHQNEDGNLHNENSEGEEYNYYDNDNF